MWADEFAQADGTSPDATKWGYDIGGGGWGNGELQTYTTSPDNARIEGGQLVIEARQTINLGATNYTSARLLTKGKSSWTYGRMEARIKLPRGQGIWPAFWMLGTNIDSPEVGWPTCGEIDIMENIGREPTLVHGTVHGPGYSGGNGIGGPYSLPGGAAFADDFHNYAVEWSTNQIKWFVDGQQYLTLVPANLPNSNNWVFTQPQYLLLNLAVGGNWPGNPDGSTIFPQRMTVDYVRIYAWSHLGNCGANLLTNPGFEFSGLADWTIYGNAIGNTSVASSNSLPVHGGSNVFKVYGQFTGGQNYSGSFRDTSIAPGANYTAGGWALTPTGDRIAGGNTAWIEVSFRDATANVLSLYRTGLINASTPAGVWLKLAVTNQLNPVSSVIIGFVTNLVAPGGTSFARYQVVFRQPASAAGAVLFDDLNLSFPGALETPVPASAEKAGNNLSIVFPTTLGSTYQVRYKNELTTSGWQVLTNWTGTGDPAMVADALSAGQRFYRVIQVCN